MLDANKEYSLIWHDTKGCASKEIFRSVFARTRFIEEHYDELLTGICHAGNQYQYSIFNNDNVKAIRR